MIVTHKKKIIFRQKNGLYVYDNTIDDKINQNFEQKKMNIMYDQFIGTNEEQIGKPC